MANIDVLILTPELNKLKKGKVIVLFINEILQELVNTNLLLNFAMELSTKKVISAKNKVKIKMNS